MVDDRFDLLPNLTERDRNLMERIARSLPLLCDLVRGDVFIYGPSDLADAALVVAEFKPHTVPPVYTDSLLGRIVTKSEEPAIVRALTRGIPSQHVTRIVAHGIPTVQDAFPIRSDGRIIGVLSINVGLVENERQKRKSIVFRRAVAQLRDMIVDGQLQGAENLVPLGEHDGPMVVDQRGYILYISSIAEHHYRKVGYSHSLLRANLANLRTDEGAFFEAMETGMCVQRMVREGSLTWVKKCIPLVARRRNQWWDRFVGGNEEIDGAIVVLHDITDTERKEQELKIKSAMIQEIHHRVKNNLQTIAALLRLQARRTGSPEISDMLQETINRILSIAVVHEFLAHDESSIVNVREVTQRIITEVTRSILDPEKRICFSLHGSEIYLPTQQATSCALIINELLQNAVEHGYPHQGEGHIQVVLAESGNDLRIEVIDDGKGLSPEFVLRPNSNLGLQIVRTLVREDLKGRFELHNVNGHGARAVVTFPKNARPAVLLSARD